MPTPHVRLLNQSSAPSRAPLAWAKPPPPVVSPSVAVPQPPPRNTPVPDAAATPRPLPSSAAAVNPSPPAPPPAAANVATPPSDDASLSSSFPSPSPPVVTYRDKQWFGLMGDGATNPPNDEGVTDLESLTGVERDSRKVAAGSVATPPRVLALRQKAPNCGADQKAKRIRRGEMVVPWAHVVLVNNLDACTHCAALMFVRVVALLPSYLPTCLPSPPRPPPRRPRSFSTVPLRTWTALPRSSRCCGKS